MAESVDGRETRLSVFDVVIAGGVRQGAGGHEVGRDVDVVGFVGWKGIGRLGWRDRKPRENGSEEIQRLGIVGCGRSLDLRRWRQLLLQHLLLALPVLDRMIANGFGGVVFAHL